MAQQNAQATPQAPKRVWIQLAEVGSFAGHPAGPFSLTTKVFDEIVANFTADPLPIPIDAEHASEADPTSGSIPTHGAPAFGWIHEMDNRGQGGLWGLVEWLEPARSYIREGRYRYLSPAVRFGAKDRVTGKPIGARMSSAAITNTPFLRHLAPLVAKDRIAASDKARADEVRDIVLDLLANTTIEEATDAEHGDAQGDLTMSEKEIAVQLGEAKTQLADATVKLTGAEAKVAELSLSLKDVTAKHAAVETENKALRDAQAKRDEKDVESRVAEAFDTYKDKKALTDDDKDAMKIVLKASPERFEKLYPRITADKRHLVRNLTDGVRQDGAAKTTDDPGDILNESPLQTTKRLMSERKLGYEDAQDLATKLRRQARTA